MLRYKQEIKGIFGFTIRVRLITQAVYELAPVWQRSKAGLPSLEFLKLERGAAQ